MFFVKLGEGQIPPESCGTFQPFVPWREEESFSCFFPVPFPDHDYGRIESNNASSFFDGGTLTAFTPERKLRDRKPDSDKKNGDSDKQLKCERRLDQKSYSASAS